MTDRVQQTIQSYNKTAALYVEQTKGTAPKKQVDQFMSLVKPQGKVLDIGCAGGRDCRTFKDHGFDVVGVDLSEELLKIAKQQHPDITFMLADMRQLPFDKALYDAIFSLGALHHLEKEEMIPTLKEWNRVLVTDGVLYIRTKLGESTIIEDKKGRDGETRTFTLLTLEDVDSMLRESGFKKIDLYITESNSRKGLFWIDVFYQKI